MLLSHLPLNFKARRKCLMQAHPESAFILPGAHEVLRNVDVHFSFRQESQFHYLTGFDEPDAFALILPEKSKAERNHKLILFVSKRDLNREMWEGERYGVDRAESIFGADEAYTIDELPSRLSGLLRGVSEVFYRLGASDTNDRLIATALDQARVIGGRTGKGFLDVKDINIPVGEMRLFKSSDEIQYLRKACEITAAAHKTLMKEVKPGMNEFEVEALVDYSFRRNGCQRNGYGSIVAGGKNAACLHYRANNEILRDSDLLLVDAGGEYEYYTSDITRTFPIGKSFTDSQAKAYDLVLRAQLEGIQMAKPGSSQLEIHKRTVEILVDGYLSLGLMKGNPKEIIEKLIYKRFYPHNTGHWLGIDVHDTGLYFKNGEPRLLEPGMCITIEPGFYTQPGDLDLPDGFKNLGIRIEDDILITQAGCDVLTKNAPKTRDEIEALKK